MGGEAEGSLLGDFGPGASEDLRNSDRCRAVTDVLSRAGQKWSILVVLVLSNTGGEPLRFNELRRRIGSITQRMLTRTLRDLERDGLVARTVVSTVPPRVQYGLSELGHSLRRPVEGLGEWAVKNYGAMEEARRAYDARDQSLDRE